jgi:hypothetical protein
VLARREDRVMLYRRIAVDQDAARLRYDHGFRAAA